MSFARACVVLDDGRRRYLVKEHPCINTMLICCCISATLIHFSRTILELLFICLYLFTNQTAHFALTEKKYFKQLITWCPHICGYDSDLVQIELKRFHVIFKFHINGVHHIKPLLYTLTFVIVLFKFNITMACIVYLYIDKVKRKQNKIKMIGMFNMHATLCLGYQVKNVFL